MALRKGRKRNPEARMRLVDHLRELRRRVLLALAGIGVMAVVGWFLYEPVFDAIQEPVRAVDDAGLTAALVFPTPAAAFDMQIRVSLWLATFLASPWWLYQLWAFIAPGLTTREKRRSLLFVAAAVPLFLGGALLAWLVLPNAIRVLTQFTPEGALNYMPATDYVRFVMRVILAFGLAFLMPVVMVLLNAIGLVHSRTLLAGWRWAVLLSFVFAGIASPTPDPWTMIALAIPICGLYFGAVGIAAARDRRVARREAARDAGLLGPEAPA